MTSEPPSDRTPTPQSAAEDLAFMRAVAERGGGSQMAGGVAYVAGGLLYGLQCLFHWGQMIGRVKVPPLVSLVIVVGVTVSFLAILSWVLWRTRQPAGAGAASRALNAAFTGAGLANLAMVAVFAVTAGRQQSFVIWELYPVVVFALQGAAWWVAFALRRRLWLGVTAAGWFVTAVALGLLAGSQAYVLGMAFALLLMMVIPGAVMIRLARRPG